MVDVGRAQHPKTPVVVAVLRMVVVAVARARIVLIVVPGTAAQHAGRGLGPPHRFPGSERIQGRVRPVEPGHHVR